MLLDTLVKASAEVAATSSRLRKRDALAEPLRAAAADADDSDHAEVALAATYLSGAVRQRRTGVGAAGLRTLPPPAERPSLTLAVVDASLERLSRESGAGSAGRRTALLAELFGAATAAEQDFLRALLFGELRQGASESLVQDAVAQAFTVPRAAVQRAAMLSGSTAHAAVLAAKGGLAALAAVTLRVGTAVSPMLAASAPDADAAAHTVGLPAFVDVKMDGIRVQVHRWPGRETPVDDVADDDDGEGEGDDQVRLFTRSLDDITDRLPEVVEQVRALPATTLVLDGEVVGLRPDGSPLPFQTIAARTASSADPVRASAQVPLQLVVFDALRIGERDLVDEPLSIRVAALADLLPPALAVTRRLVRTPDEVAQLLTTAVAGGWEGVVVKKPDAPYAAGRRDSGWVKVKPRHTFDLAVIGAEWGYGRRKGWLSNLHLAARDPATGSLVMLGKTFKGLTDAVLAWQTGEMLARERSRTAAAVLIDPPLVAEIAIDGVQVSTRYPGGVALRFARVLRYRDDKTPAEVDSLADILALAPVLDG